MKSKFEFKDNRSMTTKAKSFDQSMVFCQGRKNNFKY